MKNIFLAVLLVAALSLGAICWKQHQMLAQSQTQLADAQKQLSDKTVTEDKVANAEHKTKILRDALTDTSKFAAEKSQQAAQLQQQLADTKTNTDANPFASMFKDPAMKEMIKSSQKTMMGPIIAKQYAALIQQLGLTPEQSATLKDLLQQKMLAGSDAGMSLLDGSMDATNRADLAKQIKSQNDDYDAQIKQFLGDDNYKSYQDYEKTIPYRTEVSQFNDQLADGPNGLTPDQQQQMIQVMSDEQNNFKWTTDMSNPTASGVDMTTMFTEDKVNQYAQEKEKLDQQTLTRVQPLLTPDQFTSFQQFQASQRDMQMMGMKMAAKMFAPKTPPTGTAP